MESGKNAPKPKPSTPLAETIRWSLDAQSEWDCLVPAQYIDHLKFDHDGKRLIIIFTDDSALRVERQSERGPGLVARVVRVRDSGRMPAPWEDV